MNKKIENLKDELIAYLQKHDMWQDVYIYCNGKCWGTSDKEMKHFRYGGEPFEYEDDPHRVTEYAGDILTMTFEGPLYEALNYGCEYGDPWKTENDLQEMFKRYGLYYEMGESWNLTACKI